MWSKKGAISAMIGAAMLAVPVSALAAHHDHDGDFHGRPQAWHDQGEHRGWFKHDRDDHFRGFRPVLGSREYPPRIGEVAPPPRMVYWNPEPYQPAPPPARYHHIVADDDCNWGGGYNYGQPMSYYNAYPPAGYGASQQASWLLQRRQQAYVVLAKMRARGDRNAANRMLGVINNLNARINRLNGRGIAYMPPVNYGAAAENYAAPVAGNMFGNGYNPYAAGYNTGYQGSPTVGALAGMVGPLLGLPPY